MMDLLSYIKSLFSFVTEPTRKRRAVADDSENTLRKIRRLSGSQMSNNEDDWASTSSSCSIRRRSIVHLNKPKYSDVKSNDVKYKITWNRDHPTITIDDEDEEVVKKPKEVPATRKLFKTMKYTSTPNNSSRNKSDDLYFTKYIESPLEKKLNFKKQGYDYVRPSSAYLTERPHNGTRSHETVPCLLRDMKPRYTIPARRTIGHSSALDQSFRLDEKRKYRELLARTAPNSFNYRADSIADYGTPVGKIFGDNLGRGKKMVEMIRFPKTKPMDFIDLTDFNSKPGASHSKTTKQTIKKVLEEFDNDVIEVKAEDSLEKVLPRPPSPVPDIKVERINSLKTFVDPSEPLHEDWISNLLDKHNAVVMKREKVISEQKEQIAKFSVINNEIRMRRLEDDVKKVLLIKEVLIPIEQPEEKLPKLTEDQDKKVARSFDRRYPDSEVLVNKFNLNITRHDIMTLYGLNWLNDEVINFYMNLIIERAKDSKWPNAYAMNTFFYPKVSKDGYNSVRRWTKKVDLFAYDIIVFPIHLSMHWCVAIVDFRSKTLKYYDSMGSSNDKCLKSLHNYIQQEHLDKKKTKYDMSGWEMKNVQNIPQQMNGSDCGMFSCTFAEFLTRDAKITFSQEDMPYLRKKMVVEILEGRLLLS